MIIQIKLNIRRLEKSKKSGFWPKKGESGNPDFRPSHVMRGKLKNFNKSGLAGLSILCLALSRETSVSQAPAIM